jgi:hypothetical protein
MGKKTVEDIDWVKKVIESKLSKELLEKVKTVAEKISDNTDQKSIGKFIMDVFESKK